MSESKKKSPIVIVIVVALLLIVGIVAIKKGTKTNESVTASNEETSTTSEMKKSETPMQTEQASNDKIMEIETPAIDPNFDLEDAMKPRILGDINAPIKISEHSSFTCGHCASFHKGNFKKLKSDYVDTGKAYIIYNGFPLNAVDVRIGAIARCVPKESYFNFIQLLFETQSSWTKKGSLDPIRRNAKLTGVSDAAIDNCVNSEELFKSIAQQRDDAVELHDVKSTPTLVINDSIVILGLSEYSKLKAVLDAEYEKVTK